MIACKMMIGSACRATHAGPAGPTATRKARPRSLRAQDPELADEPFVIPDDICCCARRTRCAPQRDARTCAVEGFAKERAEFERRPRGDLPPDFDKVIDAYKQKLVAEKRKVAIRKSRPGALDVMEPPAPETQPLALLTLRSSNNTNL